MKKGSQAKPTSPEPVPDPKSSSTNDEKSDKDDEGSSQDDIVCLNP